MYKVVKRNETTFNSLYLYIKYFHQHVTDNGEGVK